MRYAPRRAACHHQPCALHTTCGIKELPTRRQQYASWASSILLERPRLPLRPSCAWAALHRLSSMIPLPAFKADAVFTVTSCFFIPHVLHGVSNVKSHRRRLPSSTFMLACVDLICAGVFPCFSIRPTDQPMNGIPSSPSKLRGIDRYPLRHPLYPACFPTRSERRRGSRRLNSLHNFHQAILVQHGVTFRSYATRNACSPFCLRR